MLSKLATDMSRRLYNINLSELKILSVAEGEAKLSARADLERFVTRTQSRLYLPRVPFKTVDNDLLERADDRHAVHLGRRPYLKLKLQLQAPGLSPGKPVIESFGEARLAHFEARYQPAGGGHLFTYQFQQRVKDAEGGDRELLLGFSKQYLECRRKMFSLRREDQ